MVMFFKYTRSGPQKHDVYEYEFLIYRMQYSLLTKV